MKPHWRKISHPTLHRHLYDLPPHRRWQWRLSRQAGRPRLQLVSPRNRALDFTMKPGGIYVRRTRPQQGLLPINPAD